MRTYKNVEHTTYVDKNVAVYRTPPLPWLLASLACYVYTYILYICIYFEIHKLKGRKAENEIYAPIVASYIPHVRITREKFHLLVIARR